MSEMETFEESDRLKANVCYACKKDLQGVLSEEQLEKFEEIFYQVVDEKLFIKRWSDILLDGGCDSAV